jgi:hypothetical protein
VVVLGALFAVMAIAALFMLMAREIHRAMGVTAQNVVLRVSGILLAAVAMQFVFDALAASGLFAGRNGRRPAVRRAGRRVARLRAGIWEMRVDCTRLAVLWALRG